MGNDRRDSISNSAETFLVLWGAMVAIAILGAMMGSAFSPTVSLAATLSVIAVINFLWSNIFAPISTRSAQILSILSLYFAAISLQLCSSSILGNSVPESAPIIPCPLCYVLIVSIGLCVLPIASLGSTGEYRLVHFVTVCGLMLSADKVAIYYRWVSMFLPLLTSLAIIFLMIMGPRLYYRFRPKKGA